MNRGETFGNYRIVRRIGVGGMGEVYEVEHLALGTRCALKTFALESGDAAFLRERFMAEGRALARIAHPNVARVFDLDIQKGLTLLPFIGLLQSAGYSIK